jgi:hypothetical protein
MPTVISSQGASRPAPKWWRNLERGLLLVLIPAATAIIQGTAGDDIVALKLNLYINTGLVAIVKFIGMMLVDTEDNYVSNLPQHEQNRIESVNPTPPDVPKL